MIDTKARDTCRGWCGVKKVRDVTIGETHAERARRLWVQRLRAQIEVERRFAQAKEPRP